MSSVAAQTSPPKPKFTFHPLMVKLIPEMDEGQFNDLVADIKKHGVREPIWTRKLPDGSIEVIDGRTRLLAAEKAGRDCPTREYKGDEAGVLDFVVSENVRRRHWDSTQLAMVAARIANMRQGERTDIKQPSANLPKVSQAEAAKKTGASERSTRDAVKVIAKAEPEIVKAVDNGKLKVSVAAKIADHPPAVQHAAASKITAGVKPAAVVKALPSLAEKQAAKAKSLLNIADKKPTASPNVVSIAENKPTPSSDDEERRNRLRIALLYVSPKFRPSARSPKALKEFASELCVGLRLAREHGLPLTAKLRDGTLDVWVECNKVECLALDAAIRKAEAAGERVM